MNITTTVGLLESVSCCCRWCAKDYTSLLSQKAPSHPECFDLRSARTTNAELQSPTVTCPCVPWSGNVFVCEGIMPCLYVCVNITVVWTPWSWNLRVVAWGSSSSHSTTASPLDYGLRDWRHQRSFLPNGFTLIVHVIFCDAILAC